MQHSIIGRNRQAHIHQLQADQIRSEIADELRQFIIDEDIQFVPPNIVIHLQTPKLQQDILSEPTLQTQNFVLDFKAWSRENELAQIPWVKGIANKLLSVPFEFFTCLSYRFNNIKPNSITYTGTPADDSDIAIDPLTILPLPLPNITYGGKFLLTTEIIIPLKTQNNGIKFQVTRLSKMNTQKMIGPSYDLRAPDFSYLIITKLKDFYHKTRLDLCNCRNIVAQMARSLKQFSSKFSELIDTLCEAIQQFDYGDNNGRSTYFYNCSDWLQRILFNTNADSTIICDMISSAQ